MKTKKAVNIYDRKLISSPIQNVYVSDSKEMDMETLIKKIHNELKKRVANLNLKGSKYVVQTFNGFTLTATVQVKRMETDSEYKLRIARHEKSEERKRKIEEDKIKKEFKKLEELKEKFKNANSADEVIQEIRRTKAEKSILPNLTK